MNHSVDWFRKNNTSMESDYLSIYLLSIYLSVYLYTYLTVPISEAHWAFAVLFITSKLLRVRDAIKI